MLDRKKERYISSSTIHDYLDTEHRTIDFTKSEFTVNIIRRITHSRLFIVWGITLVVILICLAISLLLIAHTKQTANQQVPPKLPENANASDNLPPTQQINLFLLEATGVELTPLKVEIHIFPEPTKQLKQIVTALVQERPPNYRNPIPNGTSVNEVYIDSRKTAYLDFSHHLADGHIGGTTAEYQTVSAILKTVFDAFPDEIKHIQILIDGKEVETLSGHINLSQPIRF